MLGTKQILLSVNSNKRIKHTLNSKDELDEVVIKTRKESILQDPICLHRM